MADALVGFGDSTEATLVIANTSVEPVLLEKGDIVGSLQQCTLVPPSDGEDSDGQHSGESTVGAADCEQRMKKLLDLLGLSTAVLPLDDQCQLCSLVAEFAHLFDLVPTDG